MTSTSPIRLRVALRLGLHARVLMTVYSPDVCRRAWLQRECLPEAFERTAIASAACAKAQGNRFCCRIERSPPIGRSHPHRLRPSSVEGSARYRLRRRHATGSRTRRSETQRPRCADAPRSATRRGERPSDNGPGLTIVR
jgi:hypothetical protein